MSKKETKHEAFLRLMQRRLERALEELRLVSQLSSSNYENTPEEAEEVIMHLDGAVRSIAQAFNVEYATRIGKGASHSTGGAAALTVGAKPTSMMDAVGIARVLDYLRKDDTESAIASLKDAMLGKAA